MTIEHIGPIHTWPKDVEYISGVEIANILDLWEINNPRYILVDHLIAPAKSEEKFYLQLKVIDSSARMNYTSGNDEAD